MHAIYILWLRELKSTRVRARKSWPRSANLFFICWCWASGLARSFKLAMAATCNSWRRV